VAKKPQKTIKKDSKGLKKQNLQKGEISNAKKFTNAILRK